MYKFILSLVVLVGLSAQAAPLTIEGYSCDNQSVLKADIESLTDLRDNFKTNSFVQGQILKELTFAKREQGMLNIICQSEDDGVFMTLVEDSSKQY